MTTIVDVNGRARRVTAERHGSSWRLTIEGTAWVVDAMRVDACTLSLLVSGRDHALASHEAMVVSSGNGQWSVSVSGATLSASLDGSRPRRHADGPLRGSAKGVHRVTAPMPGRVLRVLVEAGQAVRARQPLVVVEAMKMENELRSPADGLVTTVPVKAGQPVDAGALLAVIEPPSA
jgi:biotin carboxyl carrier protein